MKVIKKYQEGNPIDYLHKRFPISYNLDIHPYLDPAFKPSDMGPGFGDIEYMSAEHDNLPYYNFYLKPDSLLGKSTIVYNDKLGDSANEAIALDAISHGLRELDKVWQSKYIPEMELAFARDIQRITKNSDYPEEEKAEYIDGKIREFLVKDAYRKKLNYLSAEDMIKEFNSYSPLELRAIFLALNYINPILLPEVVVAKRNGGNFTFPTSKLVENQKRISGTKRDMRRKFIKSARPTYNLNRIVNRALEGMKFAEFKPVDIPGLQENYTAAEMVDILLANRNNSEFDYLQEFEDMDDILGITLEQDDYDLLSNLDIEDTPIANNDISGFDVDAAVTYLTNHAHGNSTKRCALYVREALEAGGIDVSLRPSSAADYVKYMSKFGFNLIVNGYGDKLPENYVPLKGDVVVIGRVGSHRHGHIAMYNGEQWISDFKQRSFKVYDTIKDYTIWRHK